MIKPRQNILSMFLGGFLCDHVHIFFSHNQRWFWTATHFFHTLISLPGSVAIPSFQSRAPMMSNSAPWERPSLGGVSVISTPWISVNCKDTVNSCSETVRCTNNRQMFMQETRVSTARFGVLNTGLILCTTWSSPSVCFYRHSAPTSKCQMQFLPALVNSGGQHHH